MPRRMETMFSNNENNISVVHYNLQSDLKYLISFKYKYAGVDLLWVKINYY